jgi:ABC-type multidrug transport system fused ATPase/permease subunit
MTVPPLFAPNRRLIWGGLAVLALAQAAALVAGVVGTRLAFSGLEEGAVPTLALALIGGAALALAGLRPCLRLLAERLGQDHTIAIREALYRRAMNASPEQLARRRRGYLMLRLTGDMATLKDGVSRSLPQILQAAALVPAAMLALAMIDPRFGWAGAVVVGFSLASLGMMKASLSQAHKTLRSTRAKLVADMAERLPIASDLARLGRRQAEIAHLTSAGRALRSKAMVRLIRAEVLRALPGGLSGIVAMAVLWDGARRGLPAGELAAALAAFGVMGHALVELAGAIDRLSGWQTARATLVRHLAEQEHGDHLAKAELVRLGQSAGHFSVVAAPGLTSPVRLDLAPGARGVISGPDGDRLLRLLSGQDTDPDVSVTLDGVALHLLTPGSVRRNIGVLSASPLLLKGSVRRNICLGLSDRPEDSTLLRRVAKVGLEPALARLGGLDGTIPESGRTLSRADRLLLSALRAAIQRPSVLLLGQDAVPLPEEVAAYMAQSTATIIETSRDATGPTPDNSAGQGQRQSQRSA